MRKVRLATKVILWSACVAAMSWAQQPQAPAAAPVPPQIVAAKKIFIANSGEEMDFMPPNDWYTGGPNRTYNEFYAAMKSWGRFEVVAGPGDADVVFDIGFLERVGPILNFRVAMIDPKTHITLWSVTQFVEPAGLAKNREKNYELAMTALVNQVKAIVSGIPQ